MENVKSFLASTTFDIKKHVSSKKIECVTKQMRSSISKLVYSSGPLNTFTSTKECQTLALIYYVKHFSHRFYNTTKVIHNIH